MRISGREKFLLSVLVVVSLLALCYYILFKPQLEKIQSLVLESAELVLEQKAVDTQIASMPLLESTLAELEESVKEKTARFYPEILQDRIIVIIDRLISKAQLNSPVNTFSITDIVSIEVPAPVQPKEFPVKKLAENYLASKSTEDQEKPGGNQEEAPSQSGGDISVNTEGQPVSVQGISVTLEIKGNYQQITRLIKEIEALKRTIVISGLELNYNEEGLLEGNIQIDFYALPKVVEQDKEYLQWPFNNKYGKANPFVK